MALPVQRIAARRDFIVHYAYLAERSGFETARRFRQAVESTYAKLAEMPGLGSPGKITKGKYAEVRLWRVSGFEEYLIAYRIRSGGIAIERLIHAKRDYQRMLT
jgi:plasmid stabilization system protein ParE